MQCDARRLERHLVVVHTCEQKRSGELTRPTTRVGYLRCAGGRAMDLLHQLCHVSDIDASIAVDIRPSVIGAGKAQPRAEIGGANLPVTIEISACRFKDRGLPEPVGIDHVRRDLAPFIDGYTLNNVFIETDNECVKFDHLAIDPDQSRFACSVEAIRIDGVGSAHNDTSGVDALGYTRIGPVGQIEKGDRTIEPGDWLGPVGLVMLVADDECGPGTIVDP